MANFDTMKVPRALICCIRSKRRMSVCGDRRELDRAGIVDDDVDAAEFLAVFVERGLHRRLVAHVDGERQRPAAGLRDLGGGGVNRAFKLGMRLDGLGGDGDVGAVRARP